MGGPFGPALRRRHGSTRKFTLPVSLPVSSSIARTPLFSSLLVDNYLIFQLPLGFEEISALFSETSWLSTRMPKRGPLFSITSWLRSELFGPRPRRQTSVHDPDSQAIFHDLRGRQKPPQPAKPRWATGRASVGCGDLRSIRVLLHRRTPGA